MAVGSGKRDPSLMAETYMTVTTGVLFIDQYILVVMFIEKKYISLIKRIVRYFTSWNKFTILDLLMFVQYLVVFRRGVVCGLF